MKAIIIEDELSAYKLLNEILKEYCPRIENSGHTTSLTESTNLILKVKPDIIFMDIELDDCTAFDILDAIDYNSYKIIFTTAYDAYALKAFRYEAIDYILKPYSPKDVIAALERIKERDYDNRLLEKLAEIIPAKRKSANRKISVQTSKGILLLRQNDILHVVADGSYCKINTSDGNSILSSKGLKEIESQFSPNDFFRTHLSHLVNLNHIKAFQNEDGGRVILTNEKSVPVSRRKKSALLELLSIGLS